MKISPSVKADALEKIRPPRSLLRKREQTSFPVHPVDAYFLHKSSTSAKMLDFNPVSLMLFPQ
jgi:hypothetical protein